jgi:hypothetical protein
MLNILLAPVGLLLLIGSAAVLGVVYAALVMSARTDAIVKTCGAEDEDRFAVRATPSAAKLPAGRAHHAPV